MQEKVWEKKVGKYVVLVPEAELICSSEDVGFIIETAKGLKNT